MPGRPVGLGHFRLFSNGLLAAGRVSPAPNTVFAIIIRISNFGWAHPNRVLSQAVFQKVAAGHPKFGAEREVRSSTWESSALTALRLGAPRVPKKPKG
jgi:hypothetical protein